MQFTQEELVEAGWHNVARHDALLEEASRLAAKGSDRAYILKRLERIHPRHEPTMAMRENPISSAEAVKATTKEEEKNLKAARRTMRRMVVTSVVPCRPSSFGPLSRTR